MPEYTQKYVIVALLEPAKEDDKFTAGTWPLHVTIAGTFSIDWDVKKLIIELTQRAKDFSPAISVISHDEFFGPTQNLQVAILQENPAITTLHNQVTKLLKEAGATYNDPQYIGAGYRAHCTVQKHGRIEIGEKVTLNNLALVDMFVNNDYRQRKILKIIKLT